MTGVKREREMGNSGLPREKTRVEFSISLPVLTPATRVPTYFNLAIGTHVRAGQCRDIKYAGSLENTKEA